MGLHGQGTHVESWRSARDAHNVAEWRTTWGLGDQRILKTQRLFSSSPKQKMQITSVHHPMVGEPQMTNSMTNAKDIWTWRVCVCRSSFLGECMTVLQLEASF